MFWKWHFTNLFLTLYCIIAWLLIWLWCRFLLQQQRQQSSLHATCLKMQLYIFQPFNEFKITLCHSSWMTNIRKTLKRDLHVTTKYATPQRVLVVGFVTVLTIHDHIPSLLEILCKTEIKCSLRYANFTLYCHIHKTTKYTKTHITLIWLPIQFFFTSFTTQRYIFQPFVNLAYVKSEYML